MRSTSVLSAAALCLVSACSDSIPVEPTTAALSAFSARASAKASSAATSDELTAVDPRINDLVASLGMATPPNTMVLGAQVLHSDALQYASSASLILANDRLRGIGAEWVKGDPRRAGRTGVAYAITPILGGSVPVMLDPATGQLRWATQVEVVERISLGMGAWASRSCAKDPIEKVSDINAADILHVLWFPGAFMAQNFGPGVLGVTIPFIFVNDNGTPDAGDDIPTDIDGNGLADLAGALIFYNGGFPWSDNGAPNTIDFFSVIAHEAGHALGLNHFGKIFVTKKNIQYDANGNPFVFEEDLKYAPKALMNALYIFGNQETVRGIDNGLFCSIWGGQ